MDTCALSCHFNTSTMSKLSMLSTMFFSLLFVLKCFAQGPSTAAILLPDGFTEAQCELIMQHTSRFPSQTQLALAIVDGDSSLFAGLIRKDSSLHYLENRDSVFEIGSITKVFTSTLLAQGITDGDLSADMQISELLGYPLKDSVSITLQQLSNHTSGLMRMPSNMMFAQIKNPNNPYLYYDSTLLKQWITQYMPTDLDQETSEYSNLGAALLAYGIAKHHNESLEVLMRDKIFLPLKMGRSTTDRALVAPYLVAGQDPKGQPTSNWDFDVLAGAGAVKSTVADLTKFANAVIADEDAALRLQRQSTFQQNEQMEIALGWHIINGKGGRTLYWHNGGTGGYTSSMLIDVENKKAIILLSNVSAFHANMGEIDELVFSLMKVM